MDNPAHSLFGWLPKFLNGIAGADEDTLKQCPQRDHTNIRSIAMLMLGSLLYQTALFSYFGKIALAPSPEIFPFTILGAFGIAAFILLIDRYVVIISGYHQEGMRTLARGGMDIRGGVLTRSKGFGVLAIRVGVLSVGLAQLTAVFLGLLVFGPDIRAVVESTYLTGNAHLISQATVLIDNAIHRETDAVNGESGRVAALTAQVQKLQQNVVDQGAADPEVAEPQREISELIKRKAAADEAVVAAQNFESSEAGGIKANSANSGQVGKGPRWAAAVKEVADAKAYAQQITQQLHDARGRLDALRQQASAKDRTVVLQSRDQLPPLETSLTVENAKLAELKSELAKMITGRDQSIREIVNNAPDHVGYNDGLLAQIAVLEQIAQRDQKIKFVIILIEVVSFGLELAAVMAKVFGNAPTTYAALLARDVFMDSVRLVDEMTDELKKREGGASDDPSPSPGDLPNGGTPSSGGAAAPSLSESKDEPAPPQPPQPLKRKRGRPRKHPPLTVITGGNAQEGSGQRPDQPAPA